MDDAATATANLHDDALPALPALLSDEAVDLLAAVVETGGARIDSVQRRQVHWYPGRTVAVVYAVRITRDGATTTETFVASTGRQRAEGGLVLTRGDQQVSLWPIAGDPALPGLAIALDPARARTLLDQLDVPPGDVRPRLRAYRPGRRAVVEMHAGGLRLFVKIVRPAEAEQLHRRHRELEPHLPVPRSHGWSRDHGIVVLEAIHGRTLRAVLDEPGAAIPGVAELRALLDRLPVAADGRERPGPLASIPAHVDLLSRLLPTEAPRLNALQHELAAVPSPGGPPVPVHGDFHEAQVMVSGRHATGLLDIDTAGMGHRVDDWATMVGHLAMRMESAPSPTVRRRVQAYGKQVLALAESDVPHDHLRRRVAAVIIGLATGPFRVQTPAWPAETARRLDVAERWLETAPEPQT